MTNNKIDSILNDTKQLSDERKEGYEKIKKLL